MKVLQIALHEGIGGMESVIRQLADGFSERGIENLTHVLDSGAQHAGEKSTPLRRLRSLSATVRHYRPTIILAHSAIPGAYARMVPTSAKRVVVVHSPGRDLLERQLRWFELAFGRRSDATVFVSRSAMNVYQEHFPGRGGRLAWIPNGVVQVAGPKSAAKTSVRDLIAVSRLTPSKDVEAALDAVELLIRAGNDLTLKIVGDAAVPEYDRQLRSRVSDSPELRSRVEFLGRRDDVQELLGASDLLLHPSKYEAQGLVLAEAAVMGLPAIVSEAVRPAVWWPMGIRTFKTGSAEALADVVAGILADENRVGMEAIEAAPQARTELDPEIVLDRYQQIFAAV